MLRWTEIISDTALKWMCTCELDFKHCPNPHYLLRWSMIQLMDEWFWGFGVLLKSTSLGESWGKGDAFQLQGPRLQVRLVWLLYNVLLLLVSTSLLTNAYCVLSFMPSLSMPFKQIYFYFSHVHYSTKIPYCCSAQSQRYNQL